VDIAALVIGILALGAAVMVPVFFLRMAKPNISVLFTHHYSLNLNCQIKNVPAYNRFLKLLGIERNPIEDLSVSILIKDVTRMSEPTQGIVYGDLANRLLTIDDIEAKHIRLPASDYGAFTDVIIQRDGKAYINDNHNHSQRWIDPGLYILRLDIFMDGKKDVKTKHFRVNMNEPLFEWVQ
jgi:hypothetical protein